jgi:hypothetical protein
MDNNVPYIVRDEETKKKILYLGNTYFDGLHADVN